MKNARYGHKLCERTWQRFFKIYYFPQQFLYSSTLAKNISTDFFFILIVRLPDIGPLPLIYSS